MNICIVTHERFGPQKGGVESVCYILASEIHKLQCHNIYHLYQYDSGTIDIPYVIAQQLPSASDDDAIDKIHQFISENKIDILWNHSPSVKYLPLFKNAIKNLDTRIVSIYHNMPNGHIAELRDRISLSIYQFIHKKKILPLIFNFIKYPLSYFRARNRIKTLMQGMVDNSDKVCMLSEYYCTYLKNIIEKKKFEKITHINNPLIAIKDDDVRYTKRNQIIVVARHVWKHKRIDRMLHIWKTICNDVPDWELLILGDGPDHNDYIELANNLHLSNIRFLGMVNPTPYYKEAKIICMTSTWEGLPMVLIEAQQYGCVPIAYESFAALADIIENGKTGYKIPPYKRAIFVQKLLQLVNNEQEREQMSQNCIVHSKNFQAENIAKQWLNLFQDILNRR